MGILQILAILAPFIQSGIQIMESLFTEAKSGAVKLQTLTSSVNNVLDGFGAVSTGGQANTVNLIKPLVPALINDAVAAANAIGGIFAGKNVVDTSSTPGPAKSEA
jgi:hypothetical protein